MTFRKKGKLLLASIVILSVLLVLDIWINKADVLEVFGNQFVNEQRTDEYEEAHRALTKTVEKQLEIERADIKEISLINTSGDIAVKPTDGNTIRLVYTVRVTDRNDPDRKLDEVTVEQEINNGRLSLNSSLEGQRIDSSSISIDYVLYAPDDMRLWMESENGSIHIEGTTGDVDVISDGGLMEIVHVEGNLKLRTSNNQLFVSNIKGNIELESQFSDTDMDHIEGEVALDSEYGDHMIIGISGGVTAVSFNGTVHLRDIGGPVEVTSDQSNIQLAYIRNDIQVEAESGTTSLILSESEGYTLDAKVTYGSIRTQLPFPIERISETDENLMSGIIGSGAWQVDLDIREARLTIHESK